MQSTIPYRTLGMTGERVLRAIPSRVIGVVIAEHPEPVAFSSMASVLVSLRLSVLGRVFAPDGHSQSTRISRSFSSTKCISEAGNSPTLLTTISCLIVLTMPVTIDG
jgi:hypothetical protein